MRGGLRKFCVDWRKMSMALTTTQPALPHTVCRQTPYLPIMEGVHVIREEPSGLGPLNRALLTETARLLQILVEPFDPEPLMSDSCTGSLGRVQPWEWR